MKLEARKLRKRKEKVKAKLSAKREKLKAERKIQHLIEEMRLGKMEPVVLTKPD